MCRVKATLSDDQIKPAEKLNIRRVFAARIDAILGLEENRGFNTVTANDDKTWNRIAVQTLDDPQVDRILSFLHDISKVSVSYFPCLPSA